jgi:hypothetical protein
MFLSRYSTIYYQFLESILPGRKCPDVGLESLPSQTSFPLKYHNEVEAVGPPLGQIHRENVEEMSK